MSKAESVLSKVKRFAPYFAPTFQASSLASLCNYPNEKTELGFLFNYWPFLKYRPQKTTPVRPGECSSAKNSTELRDQDKELIRNEWQNAFASGSITFDDQSVMRKVNANLSSGFQPEWDEDSNEIKFEHKRMENKRDENNNDPGLVNIQEQLYQDKRNLELEKYKSAVRLNISKERGNQLEPHVIEKINKEENMNFVQDKALKTVDMGFYKICGIIDGIDNAKNTLIEVKTRKVLVKNKRVINLRDRIQCLTYLKLTNCERCLLVESGPDGEQNKFYIEWDEEEFEDRIASRLREFVIKYRTIKESEFRMKVRKYKF